MFQANIVADSVCGEMPRLTTFQLRYPRFIHAELMTHRMFSRNASSSRAIPVAKMIQQVRENPATPLHWGINRPGMQAHEQLRDTDLSVAQALWQQAADNAARTAQDMAAIGLHKQVANRILEPFQYISVIVTATDWDNFFKLRCHPDAQPEIQLLATLMRDALTFNVPSVLKPGEWHLPYITEQDFEVAYWYAKRNRVTRDEPSMQEILTIALKASVARCARVSYLTHEGTTPDITKDIELHDKLVVAEPLHASPAEHQATPCEVDGYVRNFRGWMQYRVFLEEGIAPV